MKQIKKLVALGLALTMAASTSLTVSASEKDDGEKQVLTMMNVGTSSEQAYIDIIEGVVEKFNAENEFNVEIQTEWYEQEQYKTKLPTLMTQNEAGDIFFTWAAGFLKPYVENGRVYALNEALEADPEWGERFYDGVLQNVTYDDKVYAVPSTQTIYGVYYNKELFKKYELEVPKTWEEFISVGKTLIENGVTPLAMGGQDSWVVGFHLLLVAGGVGGSPLYDEICAGTTTWDDERFIESGKVFQELSDMGFFNSGYLGVGYNEGREVFLNGTAAMYPMGSWDTSAVLEGFGGDEDKVGVFVLPALKEEYNNTTVGQVDKIYAISENCENKEAACAFLKYLSDPEVQGQLIEKTGALPVADSNISEDKVDGLTKDLMEKLPELTMLLPMNLQFGSATGEEFNNISVAIAGGNDVEEQFKALQEYAENE